jgi:hypothetical protein
VRVSELVERGIERLTSPIAEGGREDTEERIEDVVDSRSWRYDTEETGA